MIITQDREFALHLSAVKETKTFPLVFFYKILRHPYRGYFKSVSSTGLVTKASKKKNIFLVKRLLIYCNVDLLISSFFS